MTTTSTTTPEHPETPAPETRTVNPNPAARGSVLANPHLQRLGGCLVLAFVLALMVGDQEGTQNDFGFAFRKAIFAPRILVFLLIGLLLWAAITFAPRIRPYLVRPGVRPLLVGAITVVASNGLLHWTDDGRVDGGKLNALASAASDTGGLSSIAKVFFGSVVPATPWLLLIITVALASAAIVLAQRGLAWAAAGLALVVGIWGYAAQTTVRDFLGTPDHSTGAQVALLGYLAMAAAAVTTARARTEVADTPGFVDRVFSWRPGLPLAVIGTLVSLVALLTATWFSPGNRNDRLFSMPSRFTGTGLDGFSSAYLLWLVWVLAVAAIALAFAATYLRHEIVGWVCAVVCVVGLVLHLVVLHAYSGVAAKVGFDGVTGAFKNIGAGGWMQAGALVMLAGAGWIAASQKGKGAHADVPGEVGAGGSDTLARSSVHLNKVILFVVIAGALFYPPTATPFWQTVLVSEIGIYVLLAIGLNVVVGWAGLLDLGFIAFYAIGSYTTAYLVGALPVHLPGDAKLSPLLAIPVAIAICLLAGIALGAPTLRLRGDYLAIVTLGFGEIIRIAAINSTPVTNGPRGAFGIPHPVIHIGPINVRWGDDPLQFWYLLLVLVVIVVLLFRRLENSRLGRAWAAIREDEVAAQATGINTTRVKLLAFAIGASTSGLAGVFFASQIGYINPDNFLLANSILVVAYVVFGGMGSLPGAIAGAAVLTWLPEFLKEIVPAEDRQMWIGAIILLMMIFRPQGLVPARRRAVELSGLDAPASAEPRAVPQGEGMGARA